MEEELREEDIANARNSRGVLHVSRHPTYTEGRDGETRPGRARRIPWLGLRLGFLSWENSEEEPPQNEAQIRELQSQIQDADDQIRVLQNRVQAAHKQVQEAQNINQRLRQTIKSIESERDNMSLSIKKQETQIRQVQALAFEGVGGDSWVAGDDGTVRADLENLHTRLKSWAKKYAVGEMSDVKGRAPDEYSSFLQLLSQVARLRPGAQDVIDHLESALMKRKSPAMCLQGLLSHHVYAKIINRPFFVLGDAGEALQNVYQGLQQVNGNESHLWRSRTLQLLATPQPNVQQEDKIHGYSASQKRVCHEFAREFYDSPAKHLIEPSHKGGNADTQCFNDLESIVQHAGELSYRLWSRRTALGVLSLPELKNEPFVARSEFMKAHPLHRLYEDDDRCDGWFVSVVVHPAVLGFGSSDMKDYRTARVWMKAEVWLAKSI